MQVTIKPGYKSRPTRIGYKLNFKFRLTNNEF